MAIDIGLWFRSKPKCMQKLSHFYVDYSLNSMEYPKCVEIQCIFQIDAIDVAGIRFDKSGQLVNARNLSDFTSFTSNLESTLRSSNGNQQYS